MQSRTPVFTAALYLVSMLTAFEKSEATLLREKLAKEEAQSKKQKESNMADRLVTSPRRPALMPGH